MQWGLNGKNANEIILFYLGYFVRTGLCWFQGTNCHKFINMICGISHKVKSFSIAGDVWVCTYPFKGSDILKQVFVSFLFSCVKGWSTKPNEYLNIGQ